MLFLLSCLLNHYYIIIIIIIIVGIIVIIIITDSSARYALGEGLRQGATQAVISAGPSQAAYSFLLSAALERLCSGGQGPFSIMVH